MKKEDLTNQWGNWDFLSKATGRIRNREIRGYKHVKRKKFQDGNRLSGKFRNIWRLEPVKSNDFETMLILQKNINFNGIQKFS